MIRVILDTNTLISALGWDGKQQRILSLCVDKKLKLVISPKILEEIRDVLHRPKFDFIEKDKKDEFILLLSEIADIQEPRVKLEVCRDKDDNKFLELAISADVKIIISGDDDLLDIKEYSEIKIVGASKFFQTFEEFNF